MVKWVAFLLHIHGLLGLLLGGLETGCNDCGLLLQILQAQCHVKTSNYVTNTSFHTLPLTVY